MSIPFHAINRPPEPDDEDRRLRLLAFQVEALEREGAALVQRSKQLDQQLACRMNLCAHARR